MSLSTIRQAIQQKFIDEWTGTDIDTRVRFSNVIFNPPESGTWASIDVKWIPTKKITISSSSAVRRRGLIVIDIFDSVDAGTGELGTLGDEAISIYENKQFAVPDALLSYIQCLSADIRHIGVPNIQGTDPQWYKFSIRIPFFRDEQ